MSHLAGYLKKVGNVQRLTDGRGKDLGWHVYKTVNSYTVPPEYDTTYAVVLIRESRRGDRFAGGYSLGTEMLFR